jgi:cold shock CspA family protein
MSTVETVCPRLALSVVLPRAVFRLLCPFCLKHVFPFPNLPPFLSECPPAEVLWFNAGRGFGFLAQQQQPASDRRQEELLDVFVHHTAIKSTGYRTLAPGQIVDFEAEDQVVDGAFRATQVLYSAGLSNPTQPSF